MVERWRVRRAVSGEVVDTLKEGAGMKGSGAAFMVEVIGKNLKD